MVSCRVCVLVLILASLTRAQDWQRTIIFVKLETAVGQSVFMRGGLGGPGCVDGDAANDPCAIPIQHNVLPADTGSSYRQWSQGDLYLDWYGAEPGQGEYQQTAAGGSPLMWTTSDSGYSATVEASGYGYTPYNRFGEHYWMLDVNVDCSRAQNGWFEFKSYLTPLIGWEQNINQYSKCAGMPNSPTPYAAINHLVMCGKMTVIYNAMDDCNVFDIPVLPNPPPSACGMRRMFGSPDTQDAIGRIVNGNPAPVGRWPWHGVLQYNDVIGGCAGVLIDTKWAITAAHCVRGTNPAILKIRFGEQNLYADQNNEQAKQVLSITIHPLYGNVALYNDYDVALLEFVTHVDISNTFNVNTACLPYLHDTDDFVGHECWATGFGGTQGTGESYRLQEVQMPVWSYAACDAYHGDSVTIRQVCIGTDTESACGGDSGGPLVCDMNGRWVLVGTTSWGTSECQNGPSVYSRITEFVSWIDSVIGTRQ